MSYSVEDMDRIAYALGLEGDGRDYGHILGAIDELRAEVERLKLTLRNVENVIHEMVADAMAPRSTESESEGTP